MMYHKISDFCDVVNLMYEKSMNLRRLKYDTPKDRQDIVEINNLVSDIQSLARQIGNDIQKYNKD